MRIAGIIKNDIAAAPGFCVTVFVQGCHLHCPGCHNPETWDFDGGKPFTLNRYNEIKEALTANGVHRDLCIMGGEPLAPENLPDTAAMIRKIRDDFGAKIKIYVWTGYIYEDLMLTDDGHLAFILANIDCLIDGPFIQERRDITLHMRGSDNQRIIPLNYCTRKILERI